MKNLYKIEDELYIISNTENISENCWIITEGRLVQVSYLLSNEVAKGNKVILTTNKLLIEDGVQSIDDEFLEWFVKNPSYEEVEIKSESSRNHGMWKPEYYSQVHKIIIPSETAWVGVLYDDSTKYYPEKCELKYMYQGEGCLPNFPNKELCQIWCDKQNSFYEKLKKYFATTPKEEVLEHWSESQEFDKIGPTVEEVIKPRRFFISYFSRYDDGTEMTYGNFTHTHTNTTFPSHNSILEIVLNEKIDKNRISKENIVITCISELSEEDYLNYIKKDE